MAEFNIMSISLDHKGGTKSYHLKMISNMSTGRSIVINRWGKTGVFGELQVFCFDQIPDAAKFLDKKLREKIKGGYEVVRDGEIKVSEAGMMKDLGPRHLSLMQAGDVRHLEPSMDVTGMREKPVETKTDENGFYDRDRERAQIADRAAEGRKFVALTEGERLVQGMAEDPTFGAF